MENLEKIDHLIFLMMENRSFDHMLGYLSLLEGRSDVEGLNGTESNPLPDSGELGIKRLTSTVFPVSPNHDHRPVLDQIAQGKMSGFVKSFRDRFPALDPQDVMGHLNFQRGSRTSRLMFLRSDAGRQKPCP